jgi:hypothetical protein
MQNYKRSDDRIEEDINERMTRHGMVDATDIEVSVQSSAGRSKKVNPGPVTAIQIS